MADGDISTQAEAQSLAGVGVADLTTDDVEGEAIARHFHDTYERLAPSFGYETRPDTKAFDPASANGRLMIAVCSEIAATWNDRPTVTEAATTITSLTEANAAQAREIEGLRAWRDNEAVPTLAAIRVSCFNWDEHTGRHFHTMIRDVLVAAQSTITGGQP